MTKRHALIALALVAVLGAAACSGETPTSPSALLGDGTALTSEGKPPKPPKADKINICHIDDLGDFKLLNISGNALPAHQSHGDIYPVPAEGCPGGVCATIVGQATPGGSLFSVTVSWTDSVNITVSYYIEFELAPGVWDNIGPATIPSDPSGTYVQSLFVLPGTDTFRVVALCGAVSDPFTVQ